MPIKVPHGVIFGCQGSLRITNYFYFAKSIVKLSVALIVAINQGSVPCDWTKANVTPLSKKGDRSNPGNYRPISLTCVASKVEGY